MILNWDYTDYNKAYYAADINLASQVFNRAVIALTGSSNYFQGTPFTASLMATVKIITEYQYSRLWK
jgi:hypothetical protein